MKAGYVAVIGRTNAGKSTLINQIIGEKINIVSPKQQTTRTNILGILTGDDHQLVFIDTPGIHKSINQFDKYMNKNVKVASESADVIVYIIDGTKKFENEEIEYLKNLIEKGMPVILAVNKIDISSRERLMFEMLKLNNLENCEIVPISAEKNKNIDTLKNEIIKKLPEVETLIFPKDDITDKSISFLCSEMIREKVLRYTNQEIPHGVMCIIKSFKEGQNLVEIEADIVCERDSHKGIIIGKGGSSLKRIGASARIDMEKLIGKKAMLKLFVLVENDWRNKPQFFGVNGY